MLLKKLLFQHTCQKNEKLWQLLISKEKLIGDRNAQESFLKKMNTL